MIEGSGVMDGVPAKAGDVWYLEAAVGKIAFCGDAVFLRVQP
jgi:hypothetical protein